MSLLRVALQTVHRLLSWLVTANDNSFKHSIHFTLLTLRGIITLTLQLSQCAHLSVSTISTDVSTERFLVFVSQQPTAAAASTGPGQLSYTVGSGRPSSGGEGWALRW